MERFAAEGARICVVDFDDAAGPRPSPTAVDGLYVHADAGDAGEVEAAFAACERELGGVDVAYLNAGIAIGVADMTALTDAEYHRIMRVNVDGVVWGTRAAIPAMQRRGGGAIVATSSLAGLIPFALDPVYDLSKHAVVGFIRSVAPTLRPFGITANTVNPGMTDTNILSADAKALFAANDFPLMPAIADRRRRAHDRHDRAAPASAGCASRAATPSRTGSTTCPGPAPPAPRAAGRPPRLTGRRKFAAGRAGAVPVTLPAMSSPPVAAVRPRGRPGPAPPGAAAARGGRRVGAARRRPNEPDEQVLRPTKLIRIASMVRTMLDEVRRAPLDDAGRKALREIHERSLHELDDILSPELQAELDNVVIPFGAETPSESELRIAQAQLVGWLEGLFHGIQATLFTQQAMAQQQFEEMRRRQALQIGGGGEPGERPPGRVPLSPMTDTDRTEQPLEPTAPGATTPPRSSPTGPTAALAAVTDELATRRRRSCSRARRARSPSRSRSRARARLRAPGRRLRRGVRRVLGRRDPRQAQGHPADVGGAHLQHRRARR